MNLKDTYNKIAKDWWNDHREDGWWKPSVDAFAKLFKKGDTILDVGCGPGITSRYLISKGLDVTGVDFSEEFISIAKKENREAEFRIVDLQRPEQLESLPIVRGVLAKAVFLHLSKSNVLGTMKDLCAHLVSGGYFYVAVKEKKPDGKEEELLKESDYGYEYERYFSFYTLPEVEELFSECGLTIVHKEVSALHKTNWVIVIGRK